MWTLVSLVLRLASRSLPFSRSSACIILTSRMFTMLVGFVRFLPTLSVGCFWFRFHDVREVARYAEAVDKTRYS
jgi:hypothetical protein